MRWMKVAQNKEECKCLEKARIISRITVNYMMDDELMTKKEKKS